MTPEFSHSPQDNGTDFDWRWWPYLLTQRKNRRPVETRDPQVAPRQDVRVSLWNKSDTHLRRDDIICHVPESVPYVRSVGECEAFHFGGDGADDRIVLLVGLPHHANVPATTGKMSAAALRPHPRVTALLTRPHTAGWESGWTWTHIPPVCWGWPAFLMFRNQTPSGGSSGRSLRSCSSLHRHTHSHTPVMICAPTCNKLVFKRTYSNQVERTHPPPAERERAQSQWTKTTFHLFDSNLDPTKMALTQPFTKVWRI